METQGTVANDPPMSLAIQAHTSLEDTLILAQAASEEYVTISPAPYHDSTALIEAEVDDEDEDTSTETPYLTAFMRAFHGAGAVVDGRA
jgi:hypothetical protein